MGEKINERWETTNGTFRIRVTAYAEENGGFVGGAYYVFESAPLGSEKWRKIVTVHLDDPDPIRRQNVRFIGERMAFLFLHFDYAVSTDAGLTWSLWNATENMPDWQSHRSYILNVQIKPTGDGTMLLQSIDPAEQVQLKTRDYGKNWNAK